MNILTGLYRGHATSPHVYKKSNRQDTFVSLLKIITSSASKEIHNGTKYQPVISLFD